MTDQSILSRAVEYATLSGMRLDLQTPLGDGTDGKVWKTSRKTAVKCFQLNRHYAVELECYQRFRQRNVSKLDGFAVPRLVDFSDKLMVIEMGIVRAPFLLDFAKCWLDRPADYSTETMEDWDSMSAELFEDNWDRVKSLLMSLTQFGIYYYDAKPQNIKCSDDE